MYIMTKIDKKVKIMFIVELCNLFYVIFEINLCKYKTIIELSQILYIIYYDKSYFLKFDSIIIKYIQY